MSGLRYTVVFFIFLSCLPTARATVTDSLKQLLPQLSGVERLETLIELADELTYSSPPAAIDYSTEAIAMAEQLRNTVLRFKALKVRAYAHGYAGHIMQSIEDMQSGLDYYNSIADTVKIAEAISDLGYLYQSQGMFDKALEHFQTSLSLREKVDDKKGIAYSYNNIGALYWRINKYFEALNYYQLAIDYFEGAGMDEETAITLANIGEIYLLEKDFAQALEYFDRALKLNQQQGHHIFAAKNLNSTGKVFLAQGETERAITYFKRAADMHRRAGDQEGWSIANYQLGQAYETLKQNKTALEHYTVAINTAETIKMNDLLVKALNRSAALNHENGQDQLAYIQLLEARRLQDSIFTLQQAQQIEELKTRYETERHILENNNLKDENRQNETIIRQQRGLLLLLVGLGFLSLLILILLYQRSRSLSRLRSLELEQKLLRSQMNPHFIFNTLTAIQNNILKKTAREGVNLISSLASLLRLTLENSSNEFIPLEKELQTLNHYLLLQQQRYGGQFDYSIDIDPSLDKSILLIPPMMMQPFIENAIEHGFTGIEHKGVIRISYQLDGKHLKCEVEDNGIGYQTGLSQRRETKHRSFGIEITHHRIQIMKKKFHMNARLEIIDKTNEMTSGTLVRLILPYKELCDE